LKRQFCPYKADIWAFGIMLYWMVMGYFPQENVPMSSKKSIKRDSKNPANFELLFPVSIHPGIEYLIEKMLEKDPSNRVNAA
jgi:serine/threonine protein kinase